MTEQRRIAQGATAPRERAAGLRELDALRAKDVSLIEFVKAGGSRALTVGEMFA